MAEKGQSQTRRVSFAVEPEVQYIPTTHYEQNKTSSSGHETMMDITTEIPEFKNMALFQPISAKLADENIDELFARDSTSEFHDDSMEASEYVRRLSISAKRNSLEAVQDGIISCVDANIVDRKENIENKEGLATKIEELENKPEIENEYNDTTISNSSYIVEELINTVDLKAMLPQAKTERKDLDEFLSSLGIRFLDDAMIDTMRRDTLSKSRNVVDPSLVYYYRYSLKDRIEYFHSFSAFLGEKMRNLQTAITEAQNNVDFEILNKENLKRIRNESRNRARVDWYTLRRINELQFNKKIIQNKQILVENKERLKRNNLKYTHDIKEKEANIGIIEGKINEIRERLARRRPELVQEAEQLQRMIVEQKALYESVYEEHEAILRRAEERNSQIERVDLKIKKLRDEIEGLKKNLITRNISETMLEEIKREVKRYALLFDLKITNISEGSIQLCLTGCSLSLNFNIETVVTDCSLKVVDSDSPVKLISSSACLGYKLRMALRNFMTLFSAAKSLEKEINRLKSQLKVEWFIFNNVLRIRYYVSSSNEFVDLIVDEKYDVYRENTKSFNFIEDPAKFQQYLLGYQNE